ncbi:hypothetical protein COOONC_18372 [Cooperia oncophora]
MCAANRKLKDENLHGGNSASSNRDYGINSILYQRGLYPGDTFKREKKYGLTLLVTNDSKLQQFLEPLLKQIECSLVNDADN